MKYPEFIAKVADRAAVPRDEAVAISYATLRTLGERITGGEARDLAAQLPKELQDALNTAAEEAEPFDLDEFVWRVGERARVAPDDARDGIHAMFQTLEGAISFGEFDDVLSQLPKEFAALAKPIILP